MNNGFKRLYSLISIVLMLAMLITPAYAHSGRTDSSGGHKDNKNKSGLGSYHYHCGGYPAHLHTSGYCPYRDVFPKKVSVKAEKSTLKKGETVNITAAFSPSNVCDDYLSWETSDRNIVRISGDTITAVDYGTATITATSFNGKVGSLKITVKEILPKSVSIAGLGDSKNPTLNAGDSLRLTAEITPADVDNPAITWTSSDPQVASVSGGFLRALSGGSAVITATTANGKTGTKKITVNEVVAESITITNVDNGSLSLEIGKTSSLSATILPVNTYNKFIKWESNDPSIVTISNGVVQALKEGTAVVSATTANDVTASVEVQVYEIIAERIDISSVDSLYLGDESSAVATIYPADTTFQDIEWTSSDPSILSVDKKGHLTATGVGEATISVKQKDVSTSVVITVLPIDVEKITVIHEDGFNGKIGIGEISQFSAIVYPENATYLAITWATTDSQVASVDESGAICGVSTGEATIIGKTIDGAEVSFAVKVVNKKLPFIILGCLGFSGITTTTALKYGRKKYKIDSRISVPYGSNYFEGLQHENVANIFSTAGFTNIESIPIEVDYAKDLINGSVTHVSVSDHTSFFEGDMFEPGDQVIIHYRVVLPKQETLFDHIWKPVSNIISQKSEKDNLVEFFSEEGVELVWVSDSGGTKYHCKPGCSNMEDPKQITLQHAERLCYTACKRCHRHK